MKQRLASSFRDTKSHVFRENGLLYRQFSDEGVVHYQQLMESGLYNRLIDLEYIVPHHLVKADFDNANVVTRPKVLPFISYPYEWCFSQLKDAALLTLSIMREALHLGMVLKDASAYNVQFLHARPIFIDTGSFEIYRDGEPWQGYHQFCKHFLGPLLLAKYVDIRFLKHSQLFIDGLPVDFVSKILPKRSWFNFLALGHIHLHAKAQVKHASNHETVRSGVALPKNRLLALIASLETSIRRLEWTDSNTEWGEYYSNNNYNDTATKHKTELIKQMSQRITAKSIWDIGGNTGYYSSVVSSNTSQVICWDIDPKAVEKNYRTVTNKPGNNILPLLQDITALSPAIGWANSERDSFTQRCDADLVLALALVHHLAISNNLPLGYIAHFFCALADHLIIEFVPKEDSQVKKLLANRKDIFPNYNLINFVSSFSEVFDIVRQESIRETKRTLFLMKRKTNHEALRNETIA